MISNHTKQFVRLHLHYSVTRHQVRPEKMKVSRTVLIHHLTHSPAVSQHSLKQLQSNSRALYSMHRLLRTNVSSSSFNMVST